MRNDVLGLEVAYSEDSLVFKTGLVGQCCGLRLFANHAKYFGVHARCSYFGRVET